MYYVIAYDIVCDKRRNKVSHILKDYGERINYSVFECQISSKTFDQLKKRIHKEIDLNEDSVLFFRLCLECKKKTESMGILKPFQDTEKILNF